MPIDSARVVSYSTSIDPIIVSVPYSKCKILVTLNYEGSRSSGVKVHSINQKLTVGFPSHLCGLQCHISHNFRDI